MFGRASLGVVGLARAARLCHVAAMSRRTPMAGGFFLVVPIIAGFFVGLSTGRAMQGALVGAGAGILLAVAIWLVDRARQRR